MHDWSIARTIYELGEGETRARPALIHAASEITFAELRRRAAGIASFLQELGLPHGAHVGHYLGNSNAYMETFVGAGLAGMAHVNINYRYRDQELIELCRGLEIRVLVFDAEFAERVAAIRPQLRKVVVFIQVGGTPGPGTESLARLYDREASGFQPRTSSDDLILIATGGTTGLPKGVQWRNEDLWHKLRIGSRYQLQALCPDGPLTPQQHRQHIAALPPPPPFLCLSPLMHGAGLMMALLMLGQGTALITLPGQRFDADLALDCIHEYRVASVVLVGDAFGNPLLEALERRPGAGLLASLRLLVSTGASLGEGVRQGLLRHQPELVLLDTLGSSEASGYALSTPQAGVFQPLPTTRVLDDAMQEVLPGSDAIGMAYAGGPQPIGYFNAPAATAETFVAIDGERYVRTGDRCRVRQDGMLVLLGRDSTVINTGGEKVYTVEVEQVLLQHPAIADALVIGLPHPRFGQQVVALVEGPGLDETSIDREAIRAQCAERLADYKVPRLIFAVPSLQRAANGKPDYGVATALARECLAQAEAE